MEPNYSVIESVIHEARQQRSEHLGEMISSSLNWCTRLLSHARYPQTALSRVLPP